MKVIKVSLDLIEKMISLFIQSLCYQCHKAVEQRIINLAYFFGDDLFTVLDHH